MKMKIFQFFHKSFSLHFHEKLSQFFSNYSINFVIIHQNTSMTSFLKKLLLKMLWTRMSTIERSLCVLISLSIFITIHLSYYLISQSNSFKWEKLQKLENLYEIQSILTPGSQKPKLILFWTGLYLTRPTLGNWDVDEDTLNDCPYLCDFTVNKSLILDASAVLFHASEDMDKYGRPPVRLPHQNYIFHWYESPVNTKINLKDWTHFFNWTATYRSDSDIIYPYGRFSQIDNTSAKQYHNIYFDTLSKKQLVTWIVSDCKTPSEREVFVQELSKYIKIDIFGNCGPQKNHAKCGSWDEDCYHFIGLSYKFYLAFENSICLDYITEKFFRSYTNGMVPIVYGELSSNYEKIAPQGSYIDSSKFTTVQDLANYLKELDKDDIKYKKFFEWRDQYNVFEHDKFDGKDYFYCQICKKLYVDEGKRQTYKDIHDWWYFKNGNETCISKKGSGDFSFWNLWNS